MRHTCKALVLSTGLVLAAAAAPAADLSEAGKSQAPTPIEDFSSNTKDLLGAPFENQSAGISFRLPAGCQRIASSGAGDDLGQFGDEKRKWMLKVTRILRNEPTRLIGASDNFGKPVPGLMDQTIQRLKRDLSGCKIVRQDLTNVRDGNTTVKENVGMIAVRYTGSGAHFLTQQAIIQADDRLFYLLALTSPGSDSTDDNAPEDPGERFAVETFRQMLDSVRLLDTQAIAQDQLDRLVRTRAVMRSWSTARLHMALAPEQWLRVIRDGRDVGYSYITEQTAAGVPRPLKPEELKAGKSDRDLVQPGQGILIGVRARALTTPPDPAENERKRGPVQMDSAAWLWVGPDRRLEDWSRITVVDDGTVDKDGKPLKRHSEEFGSSERQLTRSLDRDALPGAMNDPKQPAIKVAEQATLQVTTLTGSGAAEPVSNQPPPWYLPQALGHLLPRLLPLDQPKSYLFATYIPDTRAVMHRYVEVGREQRVTFGGNIVRAVPITDRIGWHGSITTHYIAPSGKYLGSENKDSGLLILPTDAQTLLSIWKNANLTRPGGVEKPHASPDAPKIPQTN